MPFHLTAPGPTPSRHPLSPRATPLSRGPSPRACAWALLAALAAGCGKSPPGQSTASTATAAPDLPPPKTSHRTTSGEIALGNLTGQIKSLEKYLAGPPTATVAPTAPLAPAATAKPAATVPGALDRSLVERRRVLVDLLAVRAEFAGRIADLERSRELAEALPELLPDADSYLSRASARAGLHRFAAASADLDQAEKLGAPPARVRASRVSILEARGHLEEALSLQREAHGTRRDISAAVVLGTLLGELDQREEALATFRGALDKYEDTSPFPIAWLFFQQGSFWERDGRRDLATAYYRAALERVPSYAHAAAHLARLSPATEALAILEPLLATSDDPELEGVAADKLRESGDAARAEPHAARAAARYDELTAREPAAFADHAAQFWLDTGKDPGKALSLAKVNLETRKTPKAYELAVTAALSAGDRKTACEIGTEGANLPRTSAILRDIVRDACAPR